MSLYLTYLGQAAEWVLRAGSIAALVVLAIGFLGSLLFKDDTPHQDYYTWVMIMPRRWRYFFWLTTPPVLFFVIPALRVWFG